MFPPKFISDIYISARSAAPRQSTDADMLHLLVMDYKLSFTLDCMHRIENPLLQNIMYCRSLLPFFIFKVTDSISAVANNASSEIY